MRHRGKKQELPADKRRGNRELMIITYLFVLLFLSMAGYLGWLLYDKGTAYNESTYNLQRQNLSAKKYLRGSIFADNGEVLAESKMEDGKEERYYPYGSLFAHVIGYTEYGAAGVESQANAALLQTHLGLPDALGTMAKNGKISADSVRTTLNVRLQNLAYDALGDHKGAVIICRPDTGAILAMVSKPDYNPNQISEEWEELNDPDNEESILLNRATQGLYPPGSTFKICTTLAFLEQYPDSWQDFSYTCDGAYHQDDKTISCLNNKAHGTVDLEKAFSLSCNGAFMSISQQLDLQKFAETCERLGYNTQLNSRVPTAVSSMSLTPDSDLWEVLLTSFGQGRTMVSPIHELMITSAIANGGVMPVPYLIDQVTTLRGTVVKEYKPQAGTRVMSEQDAQILQGFMRAMIETSAGKKLQSDAYTAYGKTGTAEISENKESHSWFTGYATNGDETLAITVIIEEGQHSGTTGSSAAAEIFDAYFK